MARIQKRKLEGNCLHLLSRKAKLNDWLMHSRIWHLRVDMKKDKVEVQKGPINSRGMDGSQKATPQPLKAIRQMHENAMIWDYQHLKLHEPKQ